MPEVYINGKSYAVDENGFLIDFNQWDKPFAEDLAMRLSISGGLTPKHWEVIHFIRDWYIQKGICPLVYQTCKMNQLQIGRLKELFPTGYRRGACMLAGINYKYTYHVNTDERSVPAEKHTDERSFEEKPQKPKPPEKHYVVDVCGFLIDPNSWDEQFAIHKAYELKLPDTLTKKHWEVIYFLRNHFAQKGTVPTVYDTCAFFQMEIDELAKLFPDGYHRGASKIAGLRV
ncbi:MAG: TusE/DsrC/DsvC family sulfur relay protein [Desulfobacterales bacterium]